MAYGPNVEYDKMVWGVLPVYLSRSFIEARLESIWGSEPEVELSRENEDILILGYPRLEEEKSVSWYKLPDKQIPSQLKTLYQRNSGGKNNCGQIDWKNNVITLMGERITADWLRNANGVIWLANDELLPFDGLLRYEDVETLGMYSDAPLQEDTQQ